MRTEKPCSVQNRTGLLIKSFLFCLLLLDSFIIIATSYKDILKPDEFHRALSCVFLLLEPASHLYIQMLLGSCLKPHNREENIFSFILYFVQSFIFALQKFYCNLTVTVLFYPLQNCRRQ